MNRSNLKEWARDKTCEELSKCCGFRKCPIDNVCCSDSLSEKACFDVTPEDWQKALGEVSDRDQKTQRGSVMLKALEIVNGERQDQYGSPEDNFHRIADYWTQYKGTKFSAHDVSMMMCLLKIARIQTGTGSTDSYTDLCGYAALAADMKVEKKNAD
jgi:hypothetical protein